MGSLGAATQGYTNAALYLTSNGVINSLRDLTGTSYQPFFNRAFVWKNATKDEYNQTVQLTKSILHKLNLTETDDIDFLFSHPSLVEEILGPIFESLDRIEKEEIENSVENFTETRNKAEEKGIPDLDLDLYDVEKDHLVASWINDTMDKKKFTNQKKNIKELLLSNHTSISSVLSPIIKEIYEEQKTFAADNIQDHLFVLEDGDKTNNDSSNKYEIEVLDLGFKTNLEDQNKNGTMESGEAISNNAGDNETYEVEETLQVETRDPEDRKISPKMRVFQAKPKVLDELPEEEMRGKQEKRFSGKFSGIEDILSKHQNQEGQNKKEMDTAVMFGLV